MNKMLRTALLIDADNVSPEVVAQVLERLHAAGHLLQHRRAYGSVEMAAKFSAFCKEHAIRFLPSTFAGPNATDIALAIDAVELVLRQPLDEVVLVSSDMDYSPLIVRLRELGCRVTGYGQQGKSGRDVARDYERVYDAFEVIGAAPARRPRAAPAAKEAPAPRAPAKARAPAPAKTAAPAKRAAAKAAPKPAPVSALPDEVEAVLDACPALRLGATMQLNAAGQALHEHGILTRSGRPSALFKRLGAHFEMLPPGKPAQVRFVGAR